MKASTRILVLFAAVQFCVNAVGEEDVMAIDWTELSERGDLSSGTVVTSATSDTTELLLENSTDLPATLHIATLERLPITTHLYRVSGKIRYKNVGKAGHLELWNEFADGTRYFTKTLSTVGPMQEIQGSSPIREFILPFQSSEHTGSPVQLDLNLVLPSQGRVWLSDLKVTQYNANEWHLATMRTGAWWSDRTAGLMGGILGPVIGILGAVIGNLSNRGRARNIVIGLSRFLLVFGVCCLPFGTYAVVSGQPYAVWFPLLLLGVIPTVLMLSLIPTIRKRYEGVELRRMEAMDTGVAS